MTTRTVSRTRPSRVVPDEVGEVGQNGQKAAEAPAPPPRPAIWLQVVLPGGSIQPVGIALDAPDWEQVLDNTVTQIKLLVMRDLLSRQLAATPSATNGKQG